MKVVVVNSIGPMASTVIGATVEKFGYLNIPIRKLGLHSYLTGERDLTNRYFMDRVSECIKSHSVPTLIGGVSVKDRDTSPPRQLTKIELIKEELNKFRERKFSNIAEMYDAGRSLYARAVVYKNHPKETQKHVEYTTDIHLINPDDLLPAYHKTFEHVYFINLHRNFIGWLDSLVSQNFNHPLLKVRLFFVFHSAFNIYQNYEKNVQKLPGLHLDFDELFIPHQDQLIVKLSGFLHEDPTNINWESETYDLYGKLTPYLKTFTKADSKIRHLSPLTIKIITYITSQKRVTLAHDMMVYLCYLIDLMRFYIKK